MKLRGEPNPVLDALLEGELFEALAPIEPAPVRVGAMRAKLMADVVALKQGGDFVTVHRGEGSWRTIAPNVMEKRLVDLAGHYACILKLEPGASLPAHGHPTPEESLVLEGEVWLGDVFCKAGDFHYAPAGLRHGAIRTETGCLLYVRTGGRKGAALL
ncbi:cupin domain-containing protein [Usitatibacter palustris]|uniref:ChrR-like cupin domain-containing protein n=1 Tax=Usitatibacter palustris TaxID=2732487 RepID=A0A6M4HC94_9PROT|nr:cupin domain-containing protein [Usitatibacter palustris]QJR15627.1 hypothetical protein DSM104440_02449 [Usitatibacter palustris]